VAILSLAVLSNMAMRPTNLGAIDGRLAECPATPNCVSSQTEREDRRMPPLAFSGDPQAALERLRQTVEAMPRTRVVTATEDYLHVEYTSAFFRFVDDVEFLVDPSRSAIHFRSASRVGRNDFGVNRRRIDAIRREFEAE
jgi:uncharacterized protein (DUF1499 family)